MATHSSLRRRSTLLAGTTALAIMSVLASRTPVRAQDAATLQPSKPKKDNGAIEAITVTATRQAKPLQKVAVSVDVINAKEFTASGYKNPTDLQFLSPSIQVSASGGVGFTIRGVGTNSFNTSTEQGVGLVIDGVIYGFVNDIGADLTGLSDVEVLRGPQGTTFGKNASAGVINISTQRPSFAGYTVDAHATYGSYNDTNSYINVNVPISDQIATMFSVAYQNRDGYVYNPVRKEEEGGQNQLGYRAKTLYRPSNDLTFYLSADFRQLREHPSFLSTYRQLGALDGLGILNYGIQPSATNTETGATSDAAELYNSGGVSLQGDYKFGSGYTLTSITALRFQSYNNTSTLGATPIEFQNGSDAEHGTQVSQEVRVTSPSTGLFQYVAGAYYYDRLTYDNSLLEGPFGGLAEELHGPGSAISFSGGRQYSDNNVRNYAVYGEGAFHFTNWFRFITGGRLTYDQASAHLTTVPVAGVYSLSGGQSSNYAQSFVQDRNFSYRIGPQVDITDDMMAYATMTQGFKGALAVATQAGITDVQPERVRSYEVGLKSTLFERHLLLDLALFHEHFKDFQTSVLDSQIVPPTFVLGNAGGLTTQGVELNATARPIPELTLNGGITYQEARYTDFLTSCYPGQGSTTNSAGIGGCYTAPGGTGFTQAAGSYLDNASKWNFTLAAAYTHPITGSLDMDANLQTVYRTAFFTTGYIPGTRIGGYNITNLNIGVDGGGGKWRLGVFVRNLFDHYYVAAIETGIFDTGAYTNVIAPEARRTVGGQLDYHFY